MKRGMTAIDIGSPLCDLCGGGTYTFPSGSVWCPAEDPHAGGHFVKRVAFERAPTSTRPFPTSRGKTAGPLRRVPKVAPTSDEPVAEEPTWVDPMHTA